MMIREWNLYSLNMIDIYSSIYDWLRGYLTLEFLQSIDNLKSEICLFRLDITLPKSVIDLSRVNNFLVFDPTLFATSGVEIINLFDPSFCPDLTPLSMMNMRGGKWFVGHQY